MFDVRPFQAPSVRTSKLERESGWFGLVEHGGGGNVLILHDKHACLMPNAEAVLHISGVLAVLYVILPAAVNCPF